MPAAIVKPFDYQRRIWNGSGLTSGETLIAAHLAYLALTCADGDGWFTVSKSDIAAAAKLKRHTVAKHLESLAAKGWADTYQPTIAGRYQSGRYRLALPTRATNRGTEQGKRHGQKTATEQGHHGQKTATDSMATQRPQIGHSAANEYLYSNGVGDGAAPRGGGDNDKGEVKTAPPAPALEGAEPDDAKPGPPDADVWRYIHEDRWNQQLQELANPHPPRLAAADYLATPCPTCQADSGRDCRALPAPAPRLQTHPARPPMHSSRLIAARLASVA